jgi:hypothetical protein
MPEESIEVVHSDDTPEEVADTPSEPVVETETPAEPVETVETTEPEVVLYDLPDGRKVDADGVAQEYRNLLSDYTKKSQELATYKAPINETKPTNPLNDPDYVPATYAELAQQIKEETLREIEQRQNAEAQARQALEDSISAQLTEIKTADPNLNENSLFEHATKYGFRDLKMAHQNMRDMNAVVKKAQEVTVANIAKRADPVSGNPAASGARPDPSNFSSSVEYLRSLTT